MKFTITNAPDSLCEDGLVRLTIDTSWHEALELLQAGLGITSIPQPVTSAPIFPPGVSIPTLPRPPVDSPF